MCFVIRCKYLICHDLIDVHLYKFFTCLDINKTCLNHEFQDTCAQFELLHIPLSLVVKNITKRYCGKLILLAFILVDSPWVYL